ncbi:hypothetical protein KIW84_021398 [Lathyrus oleraceus]|uniref:Uncharacterized protein n=1 Tax=Pisum sativum TaxID=3888 RepID=A0A9D4YBJ9_PEA|nr:hypothetical protein KIW84_021398 [Pisum sativum]
MKLYIVKDNHRPHLPGEAIAFAGLIPNKAIETWSNHKFFQTIPPDQRSNRNVTSEFPKKHNHQECIVGQLNFANLAVQPQVKEGKTLAQNVKSIDPSVKPPIVPKEMISQATLASKIEVQHQTSQPSFDSLKAFTGSIIEHGENLEKSFKRTKFNFIGFRFLTFKTSLQIQNADKINIPYSSASASHFGTERSGIAPSVEKTPSSKDVENDHGSPTIRR